MLYIIYADIESLIKKIHDCKINSEHFSIRKKHLSCRYSMATIWAIDDIENKHSLYRREYCMKKFCESISKRSKNIIDFEKNVLLLTNKK